MLHRLANLGPYYFYLDCLARFYQGRAVSAQTKVAVSIIGFFTMLLLAWYAAEWFTLRMGEYPGSLAYAATRFQYLMRILCAEALLVAGLLAATAMAQSAGKIFPIRSA